LLEHDGISFSILPKAHRVEPQVQMQSRQNGVRLCSSKEDRDVMIFRPSNLVRHLLREKVSEAKLY